MIIVYDEVSIYVFIERQIELIVFLILGFLVVCFPDVRDLLA